MVAALYIDPRGPYPAMPGVECWDARRDARLYEGPHPVVAHPPCGRWCRLAKFVESQHGYRVGDDGGMFASALAAVRKYGGVLEHPAFSLAWQAHGLLVPPIKGGWQSTIDGEWVCCIAQSAYGHECTKLTWLLLARCSPPHGTRWGTPKGKRTVGSYTKRPDGSVNRNNSVRLHDKGTAIHTPPAFAEFLVSIARGVL